VLRLTKGSSSERCDLATWSSPRRREASDWLPCRTLGHSTGRSSGRWKIPGTCEALLLTRSTSWRHQPHRRLLGQQRVDPCRQAHQPSGRRTPSIPANCATGTATAGRTTPQRR